ncbi:hypothetical protein AMQ83_08635 [Paenibacillus riograndensis]|nr:hypothetical protein AMQ83_08635 [Paenibacillus riograndensis]
MHQSLNLINTRPQGALHRSWSSFFFTNRLAAKINTGGAITAALPIIINPITPYKKADAIKSVAQYEGTRMKDISLPDAHITQHSLILQVSANSVSAPQNL